MRPILNCKGQSLIEIALLTPVLLVALYVPFDFGMAIFAGHLTQNAVRDGARVASTTDLLDTTKANAVASQVLGNLPKLLVAPNKDVTVTYYGTGSANCAKFVEVIGRGTYRYAWYRLVGLLGMTPTSTTLITRTTRARYEYQPDQNGGTGATTNFCTTATATGTA